tara:strand:- start:43 stop:447 length:405 start_codon:yes stop_codon:yes gene_type:complete
MDQVMSGLALEYFGLAFVAIVGVLQIVAAYNDLRGVSFFNCKIYGYLFAVFTVGPAMAGFFTWHLRNPFGVIQGREQFGFFMLALTIAFIFTLATSSLLKKKRLQGNYAQQDGLEALREVTFFQALRHRFGRKQ